MNTHKYLLGILITCCTLCTNNVFAQEREEKEIVFTEEDKKQLQDRVKLKVEEFMDYLSPCGDKCTNKP